MLVNTMTKLPADPDAPEQVLIGQCVGPLWGAIASDTAEFLKGKGDSA